MGRTVILSDEVNTAGDIAGTSRNASNKRRLTQKSMRGLPMQGLSAILWMAVAMLAMTWVSETQASPDQARHLANTQHATAARNLDSVGTEGDGDFEALPPSRGGNDKSVQVAQATTSDTGQFPEQEHHWAATLSCELTNARRDIELLQHLEQERDRADAQAQDLSLTRSAIYAYEAQVRKAGDEAAELRQAAANGALALGKSAQDERERSARLAEELAGARRDVKIQTALTAKASEEASRLKQAGESGAAELQKSLQQERERSARLEQDVAAVRRDVETQTALAAKAGEEASQPKQAGESGAAELQKSLQQERERSARLEQDVAAARHDVETQTALAAKASEEASRRKQAADASATELRQSMQKEGERADALAQDLSMTRSAIYAYEAQARKAGDEAAELRQAVASGAPSLRKSAQDARDRAERLEQDLATARRDLETQTALAAEASEAVARARQTAERDSAALRSSLQQEHARAERLERDLALAQSA